jgi:hypothetical protein
MTEKNLDKVAIAGSLLLNALVFATGYSSGYQSASEGAKDSAIHSDPPINNNNSSQPNALEK